MNQRYYDTTLEPMQMLHAYRSGQPVVNHIWRPSPQFLPQGLPAYVPPAPAAPAMTMQAQQPFSGLSYAYGAGPGGEGSPGGVGTDGGADGSGGAGGGGGGGK